jgi:hypothetical protein
MKLKFVAPLALLASFGVAAAANALTITEEPGSNLAAFSYTVDAGTKTINLYETWGATPPPWS